MMKNKIFIFLLTSFLLISGCAGTIPPEALQLQEESLALKQLQTRRFDGTNETDMLAACAGVIQDLGFTLDESETDLGVIVASKERSAVDGRQVALAVVLVALGAGKIPIENKQRILISLVTRPVSDDKSDSFYTRVTFQRIVWNDEGQISRLESIEDADIYQEFFASLSKAIFLEGHKI